jgi:ATP-dependent Lhr-like helicase
MACWIARGNRSVVMALPEDEPDRSRVGRAMARRLVELARQAPEGERGWLIAEINGAPADEFPLKQYLIDVGFTATSHGLQLRVPREDRRRKFESPLAEGP